MQPVRIQLNLTGCIHLLGLLVCPAAKNETNIFSHQINIFYSPPVISLPDWAKLRVLVPVHGDSMPDFHIKR
jgi:hypothetical protein